MHILVFKEERDLGNCLLKDGEIIEVAEEERFLRQKHALGVFSAESI